MKNNELYHFGVKGQVHGVRRWQNEDGSLTPEGRIHYGYGVRKLASSISGAIKTHKIKKQRQAALAKARKAREEKKKEEERKRAEEEKRQQIIKTGSATDVLKIKDTLSSEERKAVANRLKEEIELKEYAVDEAKANADLAEQNSKWNKVAKAVERIEKTAEWVNKLGDSYNKAAKVINTFSTTKLPVLDDKINKSTNTKSASLARTLIQHSSKMTVAEMNKELERIEAISRAEGFSGGNRLARVAQN